MTIGHLYALLCFGIWGFVPLYWKQLTAFSSMELFGHRLWWSFLLMILILGPRELYQVFRSRRSALGLFLSSALVMSNWYLFVWAVNAGHIVEASLGYFLNPLFSVLLGVVILKEKLRKLQWAAVMIAGIGVAFKFGEAILSGSLSDGGFWSVSSLLSLSLSLGISLGLALTFSSYGLVRKKLGVKPLSGLFGEVTLAVIPLSAYFFFFHEGAFLFSKVGFGEQLFVVMAGPLTILPLYLFNKSIQTLNLSTVGIMQYLTPVLQLMCGVWVYQEPFTSATAITFAFVWGALALFTVDRIRYSHERAALR